MEACSADKSKDYDLILIDCLMPVMDGYEATRLIRQPESDVKTRAPIPVIAITANAMQSDKEKCRHAGMDGFLPKPFSLDSMEAILKKYSPVQQQSSLPKQQTRNKCA